METIEEEKVQLLKDFKIDIQDLPKDHLECEKWIFDQLKSVQSCWSTLEKKYKHLVFKLVDYINDHQPSSTNSCTQEVGSQTDPSKQEFPEVDDTIKTQYKLRIEECSSLKKTILARNQEIQKLKLNLFSKNLEYKKLSQSSKKLKDEKDKFKERLEECQKKLKNYVDKVHSRDTKVEMLKSSLQKCKEEYKDLSSRLFYKMSRENLELSANVSEAVEKIDFNTSQDRNRGYVKELQVIKNEANDTVGKYKQELNHSRERVLELMNEIQRYEREVFMLRADKKRMQLEIGDFEQRQNSFEDYKRIIDRHKRELDQKDETNRKLQATVHELTVSYECQKKENANLKTIKVNLESDRLELEKKNNELRRLNIQKDGKVSFKECLGQLDHLECKAKDLDKELELVYRQFQFRVQKDLDVYKKYSYTLEMLKNISNIFGLHGTAEIPTQFLIVKDLLERNPPVIADEIASEILTLEDEKLSIEQNMLVEYSHGAGLHPKEVPIITSLEIPKIMSSRTKAHSALDSGEKTNITLTELNQSPVKKVRKTNKLKKIQEELKKCQLERDSKEDQIQMLKLGIKAKESKIEELNEKTLEIPQLLEQLDEAKIIFDRVKMENEVLLDQDSQEDVFLDTADENVLSMLLCQGIVLENTITPAKKESKLKQPTPVKSPSRNNGQ
ncbi:unnamed protein product [Moneuplotes crassus]|uniref:Uncharacterized protein n=1 Tax=Euplotes crassus TaxID=5936 RepID=A0AAD2D8Z5_EUPCR|nr:unnamed protein product [Moneuplotes crassus]